MVRFTSYLVVIAAYLKGLYRFRDHEQANLHWEKCLAEKMARQALKDGRAIFQTGKL